MDNDLPKWVTYLREVLVIFVAAGAAYTAIRIDLVTLQNDVQHIKIEQAKTDAIVDKMRGFALNK